MAKEEVPALVLDGGSGLFKAGHTRKSQPEFVFPSVVGKLRRLGARDGLYKPFYLGDEALESRDIVDMKYPIERGVVCDWDGMEKLWRYAFHDKLKVDPAKFNVLLTEVPHNPRVNREKTAEIMFESFNVPGMFICQQAVLSLFGYGHVSGTVLDSGDGVTNAVPVLNGYAVTNAIQRLDVAGRDITDYLAQLLGERDTARDAIASLKDRFAYVALDCKKAADAQEEKRYSLPDGREVVARDELFRAPEALFDPRLVGSEASGAHDAVFRAIMKCDMDARKELYAKIYLAGGATLCPGTKERLHKEVSALAPQTARVQVHAPANRGCAAWSGGSTFAPMLYANGMWATRAQYEERGPDALSAPKK